MGLKFGLEVFDGLRKAGEAGGPGFAVGFEVKGVLQGFEVGAGRGDGELEDSEAGAGFVGLGDEGLGVATLGKGDGVGVVMGIG